MMTFDVASIRQTTQGTNGLGLRGRFQPFNSSHLFGENWNLRIFLVWAYDIDANKIVGLDRLPFELRNATFNVQANAGTETDEKMTKLTKEQLKSEQMHMIQILLLERFHLKSHWENRNSRTYDLIVSKAGKLQSTGAKPSSTETARFGDHTVPRLYEWGDSKQTEFIAHGATTVDIADELSGHLGTVVHDKTELTGNYDFDFIYAANQTRGSDREIDENNPWPPLEIALHDKLGLRLVPSRGTVAFLVIDHAEMPSEN
jgi:uncharacterized protein (TIGR03435 family)